MRKLLPILFGLALCACSNDERPRDSTATPQSRPDAGPAADVPSERSDVGASGGEDVPPSGGECNHSETRPCGRNVGVCEVAEQLCQLGSWEPCPGEMLMQAEICDGLDNDCNGRADDGLAIGEPCEDGLGECRVAGVRICDPDGSGAVVCGEQVVSDPEDGVELTPTEPSNHRELCAMLGVQAPCDACDNLDDDCDGRTDEHIVLGAPCDVGLGICRREGGVACAVDAAHWLRGQEGLVEGGIGCSVEPGEPTLDEDGEPVEFCGDGLDNDCDGEVDEVVGDDGGRPGDECQLAISGCRLPGVVQCAQDRRSLECRLSIEDFPEQRAGVGCPPVEITAYPCPGRRFGERSRVDLVWTPVPGATGYRVSLFLEDGRTGASGYGGISPRIVDAESMSWFGLTDGQTYVVQVASVFDDGSSRPGSRVTFRAGRPDPPAALCGDEQSPEIDGCIVDSLFDLIVPAGVVMELFGEHIYERRVQIDGQICVTAIQNNEDDGSGKLVLRAPQIEVHGAIIASLSGHDGGHGNADEPAFHRDGGGAGYGGAGGVGGGDCRARGGSEVGEASGLVAQLGSGGGGMIAGAGPGGGGRPGECARGGGGGGHGGGAVELWAAERLVIRGDILANGGAGQPAQRNSAGGGGAGGSVLASAAETLILRPGRIMAGGGNGGGGGGGGRVKLFGVQLNQGRQLTPGGSARGRQSPPGQPGVDGTVHRSPFMAREP